MNFIAFFSYVFTANISPGPNAIISMTYATKYPLKKSIQFNLGIMMGVFLVLLFCCLFSVTIIQIIPSIQSIMSWFGAIYIMYLAYQTFISTPQLKQEKVEVNKNLFIHGLVLQFMNPHTILYGLSVFSTFIIPYYQSINILIGFSFVLALIAFITTSCWTLFGTLFRKFVMRYYRVMNIIMSILLVYCAISLVI